MANKTFWGKVVPKMETDFSPLDERSKALHLKGECIVAWPLNYGVIRWDDNDHSDHNIACCISRNFNEGDAQTICDAQEAVKKSSAVHFEVVKLLDWK
jgi:hypothetical protein